MPASEIVELEPGWAVMQKGIDKLTGILEESKDASFTADEYMTQYTTIYNMCTQRAPHEYSEQLYERYKAAFVTYLRDQVLPRLNKQDSGPHLLRALEKAWDNQQTMVRWLSRFFNYLDRYYVGRHNLPNLERVALLAFKDEVYAHVRERTKEALLDLIGREREHEQIDRGPVKAAIQVFVNVSTTNLDNYKDDFESALLASVSEHYRRKAAEWIESDSCAEYLIKAEASVKAEDERAVAYLHADSKKEIITATQKELLLDVQSTLIEKDSGCSAMLRDNQTEDLTRLFSVYHECSGAKCIDPIAEIFRKHVEAEGMSLVSQVSAVAGVGGDAAPNRKEVQAAEQDFIQKVIDLQDKYIAVVKTCFNGHSLMHKALKDACSTFCNKSVSNSSTAELLANFCDTLLKKGEKRSDEERDQILEKAVKLLGFINDRDVFGEWHAKRLSRRLLTAGTVETLEEAFLQRLKAQCGAQFTQKMEGMCADLRIASSKQQEFVTWLSTRDKPAADLDVKVLTSGHWPSQPPVELALPAEMASCVSTFQEHFSTTTNHKKLLWVYTQGLVVVKAPFTKETKDLVLAPFQAALIVLFNDSDEISIGDMMDRLNLPEEEVVRTVSSLSKGNILKRKKDKGAKEKEEGEDKKKKKAPSKADVYRVNMGFENKLRRVKVPMPVVEDKRKVMQEVQSDRKHAIDAAIVRIMKSRKNLEHQALSIQTMQQLRRTFVADHRMIKSRLEDLIEREFIERDENNPNSYRYVA